MRKRTIVFVALGALAAGAVIAATMLAPKFTVTIPKYVERGELVEVEQGWTADQRLTFHHTAQGTKLVPYAWFKVLEQPCFSLTGCEEFRNPRYLSRFGFLESKPDPKLNPDGLPVGFSRQDNFQDPVLGKTYPALGLTCAACHTGERSCFYRRIVGDGLEPVA